MDDLHIQELCHSGAGVSPQKDAGTETGVVHHSCFIDELQLDLHTLGEDYLYQWISGVSFGTQVNSNYDFSYTPEQSTG